MQDKSLQDVWYNRQNASPFRAGEGSRVLIMMQFRACYGRGRCYALLCAAMRCHVDVAAVGR